MDVRRCQATIPDALLDGSLLDGGVEYFGNVIHKAAEFHGKDVLQSERFWIHIELDTSLLHQFAPVTITQCVVFQVHQ